MNTVRGVGLEEARYIPAGVYHWRRGGFGLTNDSPPLARMVAALPLLWLDVRLGLEETNERGGEAAAGVRDRELRYGGLFTSSDVNFYWYRYLCLARMTGFLWWLLGAWVVRRWAGELYGVPAGLLALALWCLCPQVLAFEQQVTPALPLAAVWVSAAYVFRGYLRGPSWERALISGFLLGVAQLVDFASLALLLLWPLQTLLRRPPGADGKVALGPRTRALHAAAAVGLSVWVVNTGYGFGGSGTSLGSFTFTSRALKGGAPPPDEQIATGSGGNRFRGTWLGRIPCPVPAEYLRGLDRRLSEREDPPPLPGGEEWPVVPEDNPLSEAGAERPIGLWGLMIGGLVLPRWRRAGFGFGAEELTLCLPVGAALLTTAPAIGALSAPVGVLLTTPFAAVIAGALAGPWKPRHRLTGWVAALLTLWAIVVGLNATYRHQLTAANRAQFRLDLGRYWRGLGLPLLEERTAPGAGGGHGLLYRTFVDSHGVTANYALFVPRGYRADRPYPLILFLHGYGDRGTAGRQFTAVGLPFALAYREVDFLVLCLQGHSGAWAPGGDDARRALELLDAVGKDYLVDPNRVYLTGLSSGGTGVWDLAAAHPGRWAAIVPIASNPRDPGQAPLIRHIPCWCFHNRYDGGSPVADVRRMIEALRAAGGRPRYTEYLDTKHGAWVRAYDSAELFDWLSRQRLPRL